MHRSQVPMHKFTPPLLKSIARIFYLAAIMLAVGGAVHAFILIPSWYKEDRGWKIIKKADLDYADITPLVSVPLRLGYGPTFLPVIPFARNYYIDWVAATPDGVPLYSQLNGYYEGDRSWGMSSLQDCLASQPADRSFSYKLYDWRSALMSQGGSGLIVFARIDCDRKDEKTLKRNLMYADSLFTLAIYWGLAFILWMSYQLLTVFIAYRGIGETPLENSPWRK